MIKLIKWYHWHNNNSNNNYNITINNNNDNNDLFIPQSQKPGSWLPGDVRSHGITNRGFHQAFLIPAPEALTH